MPTHLKITDYDGGIAILEAVSYKQVFAWEPEVGNGGYYVPARFIGSNPIVIITGPNADEIVRRLAHILIRSFHVVAYRCPFSGEELVHQSRLQNLFCGDSVETARGRLALS